MKVTWRLSFTQSLLYLCYLESFSAQQGRDANARTTDSSQCPKIAQPSKKMKINLGRDCVTTLDMGIAGARCSITCKKEDMKMVGSERLTCILGENGFAEWDNRLPRCVTTKKVETGGAASGNNSRKSRKKKKSKKNKKKRKPTTTAEQTTTTESLLIDQVDLRDQLPANDNNIPPPAGSMSVNESEDPGDVVSLVDVPNNLAGDSEDSEELFFNFPADTGQTDAVFFDPIETTDRPEMTILLIEDLDDEHTAKPPVIEVQEKDDLREVKTCAMQKKAPSGPGELKCPVVKGSWTGSPATAGTTCVVICQAGYASNIAEITCQDNGKWDERRRPACVEIPGFDDSGAGQLNDVSDSIGVDEKVNSDVNVVVDNTGPTGNGDRGDSQNGMTPNIGIPQSDLVEGQRETGGRGEIPAFFGPKWTPQNYPDTYFNGNADAVTQLQAEQEQLITFSHKNHIPNISTGHKIVNEPGTCIQCNDASNMADCLRQAKTCKLNNPGEVCTCQVRKENDSNDQIRITRGCGSLGQCVRERYQAMKFNEDYSASGLRPREQCSFMRNELAAGKRAISRFHVQANLKCISCHPKSFDVPYL